MNRMLSAICKELIRGESCVFQNPHSDSSAHCAARMNRNSHHQPQDRTPKCEMATFLPCWLEMMFAQKGNKFPRGELRESRHDGIPTDSSSTCMMESLCGITSP